MCTYVRTRNSEPRLVALVAAQEEKDDYGEQVQSTASSVFAFSLAPLPKTLPGDSKSVDLESPNTASSHTFLQAPC